MKVWMLAIYGLNRVSKEPSRGPSIKKFLCESYRLVSSLNTPPTQGRRGTTLEVQLWSGNFQDVCTPQLEVAWTNLYAIIAVISGVSHQTYSSIFVFIDEIFLLFWVLEDSYKTLN